MILMGIIMFPLFTFVISTIVEENFSELEEQSVMININRVYNAYSNEINDITSTTNDWALWK
jgi:sensor domain CHASE-containing protein